MTRHSFFPTILLTLFSAHASGQYENCTGQLDAINDGRCDRENNIAECIYDGGDCCYSSCETNRFYPCGMSGYSCLDPGEIGSADSCVNETALVDPCSTDISQAWFVNDTTSAQSLAEAANCSGGTFNVTWQGSVLIERTIFISHGTAMYVTADGSASGVNGGEKRRLFTVECAVLHLKGLTLRNGNATYGGAIAATRSTVSLNHTTWDNNVASSYGGAVYIGMSSTVTWNGLTTLANNHVGWGGGAMAISSSSTATWNGSTEFSNNTVAGNEGLGGAVYVNNHSRVTCSGVTSFNNDTARSGGALVVNDNSIASLEGVTSFVANTADNGGAVYIRESSIISSTAETFFINNTANESGGALYIFENSGASWDGVTYFGANTAENGGAVSIQEHSNLSSTGEISFANNTASVNGGAIYVYNNSAALWYDVTSFTANAAHLGGAVHLEENASVSWTAETSFINNTAIELGGGIHINDNSTASWNGVAWFVANTADFGGAVYVNHNSITSWDGMTSFIGNRAMNGGAVSVHEKSFVSWTTETYFYNNSAWSGNGGALRVRFESTASWTGNTLFAGNNANSSGGAVYVSTGGNTTVGGDTRFLENYATLDGGAVFVYVGYDQAIFSYVTIEDNVAVIISGNKCGANGGGIAFVGAVVTRLSLNMMFLENQAGVAGGALYISGVSFGPTLNATKFYSNSAVVGGGVYATGSGTAAVGEEDEDVQQNPTVFNGCEFIGNEATNTGGAMNTGAGIDEIVNTSFVSNSAMIGGALRLVGAASLAGCEFIDNLSDEDEGPGMFNDGTISGVTSCSFVGNVFNCDPGSYLDYNKTDAAFDTICKGCHIQCEGCIIEGKEPMCLEKLDHSSAAGGNNTIELLSIDPGYWRATNTSIYILACYNVDACVGGVTGGQGYCHTGYEGPYCSICSDGYTAGLGFICTKCSDNTAGRIGVAIVMTIVVLFASVAFFSYMLSGRSEGTDSGIVARITRYIPLQSVKIVIVVWQILTQFSTVANVIFPRVYQDFLDVVDILNFDLSWVISVGCVVDIDFHDKLLFATLGPLVCMAILGGTYASVMFRTDVSDYAGGVIRRKHVSMILLLTFLIYSSVSSTLFKMFGCDELDDGKIYLRADYRIECDSTKHIALQVYAGFMVVLYVVGIPAFYGALLHSNREALQMNAGREEDEAIKPITDLWEPYRPDRFYYEVIECARRVLLTGALVFIYPNTAAQIAVALMISTFFIFVSEALAPYASRWDTWCSRTGHAIVYFSMFLALLLKVDLSGERASSQRVFEIALIAAQSCLILIVVVEALAMIFAWKEGVDEDTEPRACQGRNYSSASISNCAGFLVEEQSPRAQNDVQKPAM